MILVREIITNGEEVELKSGWLFRIRNDKGGGR